MALVFEKETTDTTESLSDKERHLSIGVIGVNETGRVHLNLLEVNTIRTNEQGKLLSVTRAEVAVGDWETPKSDLYFLSRESSLSVKSVAKPTDVMSSVQ